MKKTTALFAILLLVLSGWAQQDSSRIDIGWLSLDKGLTQTVSIKGEDLEKMPFVNLSDAIAAWLYGAYTSPSMLAYVVDGNPVTDVNIYPIFDIEEVTLVEHAAGAAAYGRTQQELVVITTKRGKGKGGMKAAAQAGLVSQDGNNVHTYNRVYHQYYVGAYRNFDKLSMGLSADWVRDVLPETKQEGEHITTPDNLRRWRLNAYLEWRPAKGNVVELKVGYAPQRMALDEGYSQGGNPTSGVYDNYLHQHLLVPELRWTSLISKGLTNEFSGVYLRGKEQSGDYSYAIADQELNGVLTEVAQASTDVMYSKEEQWLVRDRLSYEVAAGAWRIRPALNFSYQHIVEGSGYNSILMETTGQSVPVFPVSASTYTTAEKGDLLFLTPAVDFGLGRALDLQIGAQVNIGHGRDSASRAVFPFAGFGLDLLHLNGEVGGPSLKLFGSYAQRTPVFVDDYSLVDFRQSGGAYSLADIYHPSHGYETGTFSILEIPLKPLPVYWTWSGGVAYTSADGRLSAQYSFERRNFSVVAPTLGVLTYPEWRSDLHHLDVRVKVLDGGALSWQTGVNLTLLRNKLHDSLQEPQPETGDVAPNPISWTGGWVNRLRMGAFTAGLDLLYHFKESTESYTYNGSAVIKLNSVMLPNVYAGYRWKLAGGKALELFVESRGLVRTKTSDLLDERRYYTAGGNFTL
jgi:hypothetical protein